MNEKKDYVYLKIEEMDVKERKKAQENRLFGMKGAEIHRAEDKI